MNAKLLALAVLLIASTTKAQTPSPCPAGLIGVALAHSDKAPAPTFCVASVEPARIESGKPVMCAEDLVLVTLASSPSSFACVTRSAVPARQSQSAPASNSLPPSSASNSAAVASTSTAAPRGQADKCSQVANKFLRAMCELGQGMNQANPASPGNPNAVSNQDVISGKISCNDPRVFGDTSDDIQRAKIAPQVSRKDANFMMCVAMRLAKGNRINLPPGLGQTWAILPVHNNQINSQMVTLTNGTMIVEAFDSMASFLNYDPDEEAFVIGHEIGHVQDANHCAYLHGQASQAVLFQSLAQKHAQQACEEDADFYGLQYMWGAGFNPYAAGALMGRLEMYLPDQARGMSSMLNNFLSDHPISSERTKKLRDEMIQLCSKPGTVCSGH